MKRSHMKQLLVWIVICMAGSGSAFAQQDWNNGERPSNEQRATNLITRLSVRIPFSGAVKDSLITVYKAFYDELDMYRSEGNMEVVKVLAGKRDEKIKQLLVTQENYDKYQQFLEDMKERQRKSQGQGGGNGQWERGGAGGRRSGGF